MATQTSYYVHLTIVNILHTDSSFIFFKLYRFLFRVITSIAEDLENICSDVTQFRPVMRFDPAPLIWQHFCGLLVTRITQFQTVHVHNSIAFFFLFLILYNKLGDTVST